jgi:hypothetical protein
MQGYLLQKGGLLHEHELLDLVALGLVIVFFDSLSVAELDFSAFSEICFGSSFSLLF